MTGPLPDDTRGIIDPATMMRHVDFARSPAGDVLDGLVEWFWSVAWDLPDGFALDQQVLNHPAGNISIGTLDDAGTPLDPPQGRVYGVMSGLSHRHLTASGWTVAARTTVGGLGVFLDAPARTAADAQLTLDVALPGIDAAGVVADVCARPDNEARIAALRAALEDLVCRRDPALIAEARELRRVAAIAEHDRSVCRVDQLADAAGTSVRTLQRLFDTHVGVSPSFVIRRWRIIEAAEAARTAVDHGTPWPGWAAIASELGYADQAHLTRDFRTHLGVSPSAHLARTARPAAVGPDSSARRMATDDAHGLGYERVDDDPNVAVLVDTMDATAGWEATRRLRAWEREQLELGEGQRLLDVGCGLGEAALALAHDLGAHGEIVGVDVSAEMLRVARAKARSAACRVRFAVGDAAALDEPDDCFDVVRSERTLQWLADPSAAVAEMARVVRPGGRVSLLDTDWSTFTIDVGDDELSALVHDAMRTERRRPSNVGRRLRDLARDAGLVPFAETEATQTWTSWNPDESPAPDGCFSMQSLADDLVEAEQLASADRDRVVATILDAARSDRFSMSLTMYAVVATAPR